MDGSGFILFLFFFGLGLLITFLLIKSAIDNSRTSEEISEIRRLLQMLVMEKTADKRGEENPDGMEANDTGKQLEYDIGDIPYDKCPACGAQISPEDEKCPSCEIALK